jgi:hypothetical protein
VPTLAGGANEPFRHGGFSAGPAESFQTFLIGNWHHRHLALPAVRRNLLAKTVTSVVVSRIPIQSVAPGDGERSRLVGQ